MIGNIWFVSTPSYLCSWACISASVPLSLSVPGFLLRLYLSLYFNNKIILFECAQILFCGLLVYLMACCKHTSWYSVLFIIFDSYTYSIL